MLTQDNRLRVANRRVRKPDVLVVLRRDKPLFEQETLVTPPYLVVEVLTNTPRDGHRDRVEKLADYEIAGAQSYWIVDPATDSVELYQHFLPNGLYGVARWYGPADRIIGTEVGLAGLSFTPGELGEER